MCDNSYESMFDDTEDIQFVKCLDTYVLEYWINDCRVQVDKRKDNNDRTEIELCISGYDENGEHIYDTDHYSQEWKEQNIYNQSLYKKFLNCW